MTTVEQADETTAVGGSSLWSVDMGAVIDPMYDYDMVVVNDGVQNAISAAVSATETLQITF